MGWNLTRLWAYTLQKWPIQILRLIVWKRRPGQQRFFGHPNLARFQPEVRRQPTRQNKRRSYSPSTSPLASIPSQDPLNRLNPFGRVCKAFHVVGCAFRFSEIILEGCPLPMKSANHAFAYKEECSPYELSWVSTFSFVVRVQKVTT